MFRQQLSRFRQISKRVALFAVVVGAVSLAPRYAAAQDEDNGMGMWAGSREIPVEPPLIKAQIVQDIAKALGLDASEVELVRSLHQGYVTRFTAAATEQRDKMKALVDQVKAPEDWMSVGMDIQKLQRDWMERREQLGVDFFESVKSVLTPEELAGWAKFERDRRRHTLLHLGAFFAGEGVDVVALVDDLKLEPPQYSAVAPLLESYALEVDGLLAQRTRAAEEVRNIDYTNPGAAGSMFEKFERILSVRRQIRDANRKHSQIIASSIPGAASTQLSDRFHAESYPQIYAPTEADGYLEQVLGMKDLGDDQRRGIEGAAAAYRDQIETANSGLSKLLAEHEDSIEKSLKDGNPMILAMVGGMTAYADEGMGQQKMPFDVKDLLMDEDQVARQDDLLKQKRRFVVTVIDQVWAMLSAAQQDQAPKPDVPEETEGQKQLKQIRTMMRQSMQYAQEAASQAQQEQQGDTGPRR